MSRKACLSEIFCSNFALSSNAQLPKNRRVDQTDFIAPVCGTRYSVLQCGSRETGACSDCVCWPKNEGFALFSWINTVLVKIKTTVFCTYRTFKIQKYAQRYLSSMIHCFNRRLNPTNLPVCLLRVAGKTRIKTKHCIHSAEL